MLIMNKSCAHYHEKYALCSLLWFIKHALYGVLVQVVLFPLFSKFFYFTFCTVAVAYMRCSKARGKVGMSTTLWTSIQETVGSNPRGDTSYY
jgi:hypothetical protein